MAVIRTFTIVESSGSPTNFPLYTSTHVNGVEVDNFEWYPYASGVGSYVGVSGSTIFTVPANATVKFGLNAAYTTFNVSAQFVDRNNVKIIRID